MLIHKDGRWQVYDQQRQPLEVSWDADGFARLASELARAA